MEQICAHAFILYYSPVHSIIAQKTTTQEVKQLEFKRDLYISWPRTKRWNRFYAYLSKLVDRYIQTHPSIILHLVPKTDPELPMNEFP